MVKKFFHEKGMKESLQIPVEEWDAILLSDIGTVSQRVASGNLADLAELEGGWIHTLILPSEMSLNEKEAFERRLL